jgi:divalent metal cation (Fe/Co/Zn/Cd) transporter
MLITLHHSTQSPVGITWLILTVVAMAFLAYGKLAAGRALRNPVLSTEARVTMIDAAAVLFGVGLNEWFGWWWADPLSGLVIMFYAVKEGRAALSHARNE